MRLHFQARPWDLYLLGVHGGTTLAVLLAGWDGPFGILLVVFAPGYFLIAALFPGSSGIDWIERIVLSVGVSLAALPLVGLLVNSLAVKLEFVSLAASMGTFVAALGVVAYLRRMRLPPDRRLALNLDLTKPRWGGYTRLDKILAVGLVSSVVVAGTMLAYVVANPRRAGTFTEFYLLDANGTFTDYPVRLRIGEPGRVFLRIVNHESSSVNYTVRVELVGVERVYNSTLRSNETVERNSTALAWLNVTIERGASSTEPFQFTIGFVGVWKVRFLLFRAVDPTTPYQSLHLFVTVSTP